MPDFRTVAVPLFLLSQVGFVSWIARGERPPAPPDLSQFSSTIGDWQKVNEETIEPAVITQLGADRWLSWNYFQPNSKLLANFFVAWFQSQRGGASQPHSPQVCLPGAGWRIEPVGITNLETSAGTITVNRELIGLGPRRGVMMYWYQTPRRAIASEWAAKFWVVADALAEKRTDTSLVRVIVWNETKDDREALNEAAEYSRKAYPILRAILPR